MPNRSLWIVGMLVVELGGSLVGSGLPGLGFCSLGSCGRLGRGWCPFGLGLLS